MANQNPNRRELLEMLSRVAIAGQFPGFSKWIYGAQSAGHHPKEHLESSRPASYTPQFFDSAEYALVERLVEIIIPTDDQPGAKEAGVAEFIDFMAANDPALTQPFHGGLRDLDGLSHGFAGTGFLQMESNRQQALLSQLAYRNQHQPGQEAGQRFFKLVRSYTVMGYYTSRVGLQALDYPGLKLYASSPACPHVNDPEHKHLSEPRF